jgi:hypothetical protein
MKNLMDFYNNHATLNKMMSIINGETKISLRIVDWFVTNFAKKYYTSLKETNLTTNTTTSSNTNTATYDDVEGVAMWYLTNVPQASDLRTTFGYKPEFSGVGAFLLRHKG